MTLEEFVLLAGGNVDQSCVPNCVSRRDYQSLQYWLHFLQEIVDGFTEESKIRRAKLRFTHSPSIVCRTKRLEDASAGVLIPLGLPVRVRLFTRLLLKYFGDQSRIQLGSSVLDDYPESHWEVAPLLAPLFLEYPDQSAHWELLVDLDSTIELPANVEPAVDDVLWFSLCFLACHELAHLCAGHYEIIEQYRSDTTTSDAKLRRALEIEADYVATTLALRFTFGKIEIDGKAHLTGSAFFMIVYAMTIILGLYDARRKALEIYREALYPHPMIRHGLFLRFAEEAIRREWPNLMDDWTKLAREGLNECVSALRHLDIAVLTGEFGGNGTSDSDTSRFVPLTAMNFTEFASYVLPEKVDDEWLRAKDVLHTVRGS